MKKKKPIFKRIVIKIGTKILTGGGFKLDEREIQSVVKQVAKLRREGIEIVIVSSGAIASGMSLLGLKSRPGSLPMLQATAAVGQIQLMKVYEYYFQKDEIIIAQILLTKDNLSDRRQYLNAKNTLLSLLHRRVIPIVNENDTVATNEIKIGDNDKLSALVANLISSDCLIILTDVDGLYSIDKDGKRVKIDIVRKIDKAIKDMVYKSEEVLSRGGMKTKLEAAEIATSSGIQCIIANGRKKDVLLKITYGYEVGTRFTLSKSRLKERKKWIAFGPKAKGKIYVDQGAKDALKYRGKSLLSAGILKIEGDFSYGDMVVVLDEKGETFARGLTNYSKDELEKIKGLKTDMIREKLGYKYYDEIIHRDNLVILK